jgi:PAS domain S-box-containing protein
MRGMAMIRRLRAFDLFLAVLLVLTLIAIGYSVRNSSVDAHRDYISDLIEFSLVERAVTQDLYRVDSGELAHYDSLVANVKKLRQAERRLNQIPAHVAGSAELNRLTTELAVRLNDTHYYIEDYKSTMSAMRAGLDNLSVLAGNVQNYGQGNTISQSYLADTFQDMLTYVSEPAPRRRAKVEARLEFLSEQLSKLTETVPAPSLQRFADRAAAILADKQIGGELLQEIASVPLASTAARLDYAYHRAHQGYRIKSVAITATILAGMITFFVVLTYATRWRTARKEAVIAEKQDSLAAALKEARAQSDTLRKEEASEATILAEERTAALLRNTFETVAIVSREENYIYISPAVEQMLGLREKELIGRSVYEGIHADDLIRVKDYFEQAQKELQTEQTITYRLMNASGKWLHVESFASTQYSNPAIRGMVLNTRDLGEAPNPHRPHMV